jgi:putative salt-induced outer membrane protein YdiY
MVVTAGQAQTAAGPDELIFNDGERLLGHLVSSKEGSVTFKSDMAGEVTVDWAMVKELHSSSKFAAAEKGVVFRRHDDLSKVPQGTVSMTDQKVEITPAPGAPPQSTPVANIHNLVPEDSFLRAFQRPKLSDYWRGTAGLGIAIIASTQNSRSVTSSVSLVRTVPNESWIDPRYRTAIDFSSAYGSLSQPGQPTIKTDNLHAGIQQDEYVSGRLFAFVEAAWDHSLSQGLDLQQTYGSGFGYTLFKTPMQELDLKGEIAYVRQSFADSLLNQNLIGAVITQLYNRTFRRGIQLHEQLAVTPTFNNRSAYSALGTVNLSVPIFKHLAFTIGTQDAYLNNPPPGFKRNSYQFLTNLSYVFK